MLGVVSFPGQKGQWH